MLAQSAELVALETGSRYTFRDWPNAEVPQVAAGVYTIWHADTFVYVGMSGRGLTSEAIQGHRSAAARGKGLFSRLNSHASGRRSGDQFCLYICDRFVLPSLSREQIEQVAAGILSLDQRTREYVHEHLSYRFVEVASGREALNLEAAVKRGALQAGPPLLNPLP